MANELAKDSDTYCSKIYRVTSFALGTLQRHRERALLVLQIIWHKYEILWYPGCTCLKPYGAPLPSSHVVTHRSRRSRRKIRQIPFECRDQRYLIPSWEAIAQKGGRSVALWSSRVQVWQRALDAAQISWRQPEEVGHGSLRVEARIGHGIEWSRQRWIHHAIFLHTLWWFCQFPE